MIKPLVPVRALLAAALKSRAAYDMIADSGVLADLTDQPADLFQEIGEHYKLGDVSKASPELVQAALEGRYTNPKHAAKARTFFAGIWEEEVAIEAVSEYIRTRAIEKAGESLSQAILARRPPEVQAELLAAYIKAQEIPEATEEEGSESWLEAIKSRTQVGERLVVTPRALNERLGGGLLPGHSVIIVARPNAGKTATAISLACGFAKRGAKVLYLGNEDPIRDLQVRAVSNLTGMVLAEMENDPNEAERLALEAGASRLIMRQLSPGTLPDIERLVRYHKPKVLIVDQLRNIGVGGKSASYTEKLEAVAQGIRFLGLRWGLVTIMTTQAGDSAEGKAVLDMGDIDFSNTGLPGACDVLLMLGVTETLKSAGLRMMNLPKNKVTGIEEHYQVRIDTARSRITSQ